MKRSYPASSALYMAACAVSTLILTVPTRCSGQNATEESLVGSFARQIRKLNFKPPEGSQIGVLGAPLLVPSQATTSKSSNDPLRVLLAPPLISAGTVSGFGNESITSLLAAYFEDPTKFELGDVQLDAAAAARLNEALRVLFTDPETRQTKTDQYSRYLQWKTDREPLVVELQGDASDNEKRVLARKLRELDEEYNLRGERSQIETARDIVQRSTSEKDQFILQVNNLKTLLNQSPEDSVLASLYSRMASRAGWLRLTVPGGQDLLPRSLQLNLDADRGQSTQLTLSAVDVSYELLLIPLDRPVLQASVLSNRAWQRRDKSVLSDGMAGTAQAETIPSYVSHVLVVRNIDIAFDTTQASYQRFADSFALAREGRVDNLTFSIAGAGGAYSLPGHLYLPQPRIVSVVLVTMPKVPNPADGLIWK